MDNHDAPRLAPTLEHATHALGLWVERAFRDVGLMQAEAHVLAYLARHPNAAINDLHTSFGHKRSTLTSILDRLEARGWVRRLPHPNSRRLVAVELTEAGQAIGERVSGALATIEERVRAKVGETAIGDFLAVIHALEEEIQ
ncbi:MAG TPA: MarR family transcriptional regulator [Ktedonobacterales bacterium]|nr:MarR family transcriptional regulator [Ktedonobacterales bacterium]